MKIGLRTTVVLMAGLVLSLAVNGYLLWSGARAKPGRGEKETRRRLSGPAPSGSKAGKACCWDLNVCRLKRWDLVSRTLRGGLAGRIQGSGRSVMERDRAREAVDAEERSQREVLCQVAKEHLRRDWSRQTEKISTSLEKSLGNADEEEKNVRRTADRLGQALGLSEAERETLERRYASIRGQRVREALEALGREPRDHAALFDAAQNLFADEDELIRELHGEAAVETVREAERKSRTVVLALVASMAGMPWDERLRW